jgi:tetratricopeptide (TPR) repeat protein
MRYSGRVAAPGFLPRAPLRILAFTVTLLTLGAGTASAASDATRLREARAHYEQAVANYNLDEYAPALAEFREAYRLKPDPSFLFNIAQCHRKLGETDAALDFFRKYLRSLPDAPNRAEVERMVADLRARRAKAPVAAPDPPPPAPAAPVPVAPLPSVAPPADAAPAPHVEGLVTTTSAAPPAAPTPIYRRWWFWSALGVVAAGALIGAYAASRPAPQPYPGTLDPHAIEVR